MRKATKEHYEESYPSQISVIPDMLRLTLTPRRLKLLVELMVGGWCCKGVLLEVQLL
jgi:hypothetical protein